MRFTRVPARPPKRARDRGSVLPLYLLVPALGILWIGELLRGSRRVAGVQVGHSDPSVTFQARRAVCSLNQLSFTLNRPNPALTTKDP
jgi:hypothetical protein